MSTTPLNPSPSSQTQSKLLGGQYRIIKELGSGGMGYIFYGIHELTEQPVAIKMLRQEYTSDEVIRDRFLTEAKTLARLEHPNIVQWKNSLEDETGFFLIMQFVEGDNVEQMIREHKQIPIEDAVPIAISALAGLDYVHQQGVIHRDLKPSNILISKTGEVKLADFGIARIIGSDRRTKAGMAVGTFLYMSPEQILAGSIDHRTDIYSMGITLFEMLTGEVPFQGTTEFEVCKQHLEKALPSMRKLNADLPPKLETIIKRATEKDPRKRYQSAAEFIMALSEAFPEYAKKATRTLGLSQGAANALMSSIEATAPSGIQQSPQKSGCMGLALRLSLAFAALMLGGYWIYSNFIDPPEPTPIKYANKPTWLSLPFNEPFNQNHARWPIGKSFGANIKWGNNRYHIKTKIGQKLTTACPSYLLPIQSPVTVELDAYLNQAAFDKRGVHGLALFFDKAKDKSRGYYIAIDPPHQKAAIARLQAGAWTYLLPWKEFDFVKSNDANVLKATVKGDKLTVQVNDNALPTVTLKTYHKGRACLFVQQGGTNVSVKQFQVYRPR